MAEVRPAAVKSRPEHGPPTAHGTPAAALALPALASLLFVSGACALLYQLTWLRELRLVFGASTPATAAALAIFMGGLGLGSAWFGPRADRDRRPLRLYGRLELAVAAAAFASPALLWLVRQAYLALGGTTSLGIPLGTLARMALATLVLGPPCVLMGGTLPAAARAIVTEQDRSRGRLGLVYGANTLGAVTGAVLATFILHERIGARATIFTGAAANLAIGLIALWLARSVPALKPALRLEALPDAAAPRPAAAARMPATTAVLAAAGVVGFAFFLMELVWYRMLNPLLGGSTYSFGIILAIALLGLGLGAAAYGPAFKNRRPTLAALALTCTLEALCLAIPYALGDRLAILTLLLRPLGQLAFAGYLAGWTFVTAIVVLPAALAAGFQFPLLLGLLGEGREEVGVQTGTAYAWNTTGAIAGSLAGGFGLLPALGAPGLWRLVVGLLAVLGFGALALPQRSRRGAAFLALPAAVAAIALVTLPAGPSAAWRHTSIGAGRSGVDRFPSRIQATNWVRAARHGVLWEAEGVESSIAIKKDFAFTLMVGGKSDGNIVDDAGTQIMLGMLGAFLHPNPRNAFVIGLGTGSTAGWLGTVPSIERVEVAEIEPAVEHMAQLCAAANHDVLRNPRVTVRIGDGREMLLTSRARYDLIVSEPSNPYRAGVASLFTSEFYRAAARRLAEGGLFLQWVQIYEIDYRTLSTVYATIGAEFPYVETWATLNGDLVLVGSRAPIRRVAAELEARARQEPYRSAIATAWRATRLDGVLAHYVGNGDFSRFLAGAIRVSPSTDDRTLLEYAFARQVGGPNLVGLDALRMLAYRRGEHLPYWVGGQLDADQVMLHRATMRLMQDFPPTAPPRDHPLYPRAAAMIRYQAGDDAGALQYWRASGARTPCDLTELAMVADVLAEAGDAAALGYLEALRPWRADEADMILARYRLRRGELPAAAAALEAAFAGYRRDPWVWPVLGMRAIPLALELARHDPAVFGRRMFAALETPFAVDGLEGTRVGTRLELALLIEGAAPGELTRAAVDGFGAPLLWSQRPLAARAASFARLGDPRAESARRELEAYTRDLPPSPPGAGGTTTPP